MIFLLSRKVTTICLSLFVILLLAPAGCGGDGGTQTSGTTAAVYSPVIDPAVFSARVDNKYFPLPTGTTFVSEGDTDDGLERSEVTVMGEARLVMGIACVVVRDRVTIDGELAEDTFDWYAQDKEGNVWYFGEDSRTYQDGQVTSTEGSWEAGVAGALPGIIMKANPEVGDSWRQEYSMGVAEDMAEVLALGEPASVPAGSFTGCVRTKDWSPLEPRVEEHKVYCPGAGVVSTEIVKGGKEKVELVEVRTG